MIIDQLIEYTRLGWRIIVMPGIVDGACECRRGIDCEDAGKHPTQRNWPKLATLDWDELREAAAKWQSPHAGLLLGDASGVIDVEFDSPRGKETADRLLADSKTPTWESTRSVHRLFKYERLHDKAKVDLDCGLEIRFGHDKAQSILPPSFGREWVAGLGPFDVEVQPIPQAIRELVELDAASRTNGKAKPKARKSRAKQSGPSLGFNASSALLDHAGEKQGSRHLTLASLVGSDLKAGHAVELVEKWAIDWASRCEPPYDEHKARACVVSLARKEQRAEHAESTEGDAGANAGPRRVLDYQYLGDIVEKPYAWLWPGMIPKFGLMSISGQQGAMKSRLLADIVGKLSSGQAFPDGYVAPITKCFYIVSEDSAERTMKRRLRVAGAEPRQAIVSRGFGGDTLFSLERDFLGLLEIRELEGVSLFVIDPLKMFTGKANVNDDPVMQQLLGRIQVNCEDEGFVLWYVNHHSKKNDIDLVYQSGGSQAITSVPRCNYAVIKNPENAEQRLLVPTKVTESRPPVWGFHLDGFGDELRVVWSDGPVYENADAIPAAKAGKQKQGINPANAERLNEACEFIESRVQVEPRHLTELRAEARDYDISRSTFNRALSRLLDAGSIVQEGNKIQLPIPTEGVVEF